MKQSLWKRLSCLALTTGILLSAVGLTASAAQSGPRKEDGVISSLDDMQKYLDASSYASYIERYANVASGTTTITADFVTPSDEAGAAYVVTPEAWAALGFAAEDYRPGSVYLPDSGKYDYTVHVPDVSGMYLIALEYYAVNKTVNSVERKLYIDGNVPFSEARLFSLTKRWSYDYETDEAGNRTFRQDLNGNHLTPQIRQDPAWMTYFCSDSDGYSNEYYRFYFTPGEHTLTFEAMREPVVVSSVRLIPVDDPACRIPTYQEYLAAVAALGAGEVPSDTATVTIQAETPDYVSDSSVSMSNDKSSSLTSPSKPGVDLYNVIGSNSYSSIGQWAAYSFTVPRTGLYGMTMRYRQNTLEGIFISRAVKLTSYGQGRYPYGQADGTPAVPFAEAYAARYNYGKDWQVSGLSDGTTDFRFYFEEGVTYTVYFEVSLGALAAELRRVENALTVLNDCYLQILKLTGSDPDTLTNYRFSQVMPDVIYNLNYEAVELQNVRDRFEEICGSTGSHLATLDTIIRLVAEMGTDESTIASNLSNFKSNLGTLGTWISDSKVSSLTVDYITIQAPEAPLGRAKAGFLSSVWFEIRAFLASFFTDYEHMGLTDAGAVGEDALDVWLALGRDQNKVIRNMIDSYYSDFLREDGYTEYPVNLKLVTAGTLLPSILAGKGPDVYMGLDSATAMNYAIRDAVLPFEGTDASGQDLFPGFDEVTSHFHPSAVATTTLLGKTYGIPMTMNFAMMFYRSDFLVRLGVEVPQTWDDLMAMLPALTYNKMEVGLNYTSAIEFFLYQYGGNMWRYMDDVEYQGAQVGLDTNEGLTAFDFCCKLYTEQSFPVTYDAANRFRTGEMPIVIQDYVTTYNTLVVFATEISGLWSFCSIPGTVRTVINENGEEEEILDYTAVVNVTSAVITKNGENRRRDAWEYVKWCTGSDYTSEYANRMVALIGPSAKHAAANLDALDNMSWTTQEVTAIRDQMNHLDAVVNYPGYYIIARYTKFAFLAAVNDGDNPVDALRGYIDAINAEVSRKREEFGMKTLGTGETPPARDNAGN